MAPGVYMTDFPMPRTDAAYPYSRRRQRNRLAVGIGEKYRTHEMRQMSIARARVASLHDPPPSSPISESNKSSNTNFPNHLESSLCPRIPIQRDDQWIILKRRQGLLNIVARTIALVRRNHLLEKKVEALRLETRTFVNSVLSNPENRARNTERRRQFSLCRDGKINESVNSTMDEKSSWSSSNVDNQVEETRKRNVTIRDDNIFSPVLESETRSVDTLIH